LSPGALIGRLCKTDVRIKGQKTDSKEALHSRYRNIFALNSGDIHSNRRLDDFLFLSRLDKHQVRHFTHLVMNPKKMS
jgi:hypothetical protein